MDLTFIGDSLCSGWRGNGRRVLAAYFPGASVLAWPGKRPEHIAERLSLPDAPVVRGTAVIMAGVNSFTVDRRPGGIARDVRLLVETVAARADGVVLCSILPAVMWGRNETPRIAEANGLLCSTPGVTWLDLFDRFRRGGGPDAWLTTDGVHLTPRGYLVWAEALRPVLGLSAPRRRPIAAVVAGDARGVLRRVLGRGMTSPR